jgi:prepilin-type processing-associated H-X9-DG protein
VAAVTLVGGWFACARLGERGRTSTCARNLAVLGQATHSWAIEHGGSIPPASIESPLLTWDMQVQHYLRPGLVVSNSAYAQRQLEKAVAPRFHCPSDPFVRAEPRSYAMARHDMQPENWPPGPHNTTGVGLRWQRASLNTLLDSEAIAAATTNRDALALVKLSWVPAPADTLLLTELIQPTSVMGSLLSATVGNVAEQTTPFKGDASQIHRGRLNYLMVDGHVETLAPFQTGNAAGNGGIWTIEAGD